MIEYNQLCDSEMRSRGGARGYNVEVERLLHKRKYKCGQPRQVLGETREISVQF